MLQIAHKILDPIISVITNILFTALYFVLLSVIAFFILFFMKCPFNPFKPNLDKIRKYKIKFIPFNFLRWLLIDLYTKKSDDFKQFGFSIYVGRQGQGKTISMVDYLNLMKEKHPKCIIVTNFSYVGADYIMTDWKDFMTIRNGTDGVIFAIDEIHSEYSADSWKDFPESLLSEISQQRKQRVKIIASSQVYKRIAKQLREQSFSVLCCNTYLKRLCKVYEYDAYEYDSHIGGGFRLSKGIKPLSKRWYVQSDPLRECYDTYEKIERMEKIKFIPRHQR